MRATAAAKAADHDDASTCRTAGRGRVRTGRPTELELCNGRSLDVTCVADRRCTRAATAGRTAARRAAWGAEVTPTIRTTAGTDDVALGEVAAAGVPTMSRSPIAITTTSELAAPTTAGTRMYRGLDTMDKGASGVKGDGTGTATAPEELVLIDREASRWVPGCAVSLGACRQLGRADERRSRTDPISGYFC
jgi:hypothetical protein